MSKKPSIGDSQSEFLEAMKDVRPLEHDRVLHHTPKPAPRPTKTIEDEQQVLKDMLSDEFEPSDIQPGDVLSYCREGVQRKVFRKLRSGRYRISDEIDLHGLNSVQARELLLPWLQNVRQLESCCVRVIHGKGNRSTYCSSVIVNIVKFHDIYYF